MKQVTIRGNELSREEHEAFMTCKSVEDRDGIEHDNPQIVFVSSDDFEKQRISGSRNRGVSNPDYTTITGPGCYYVKGTNYLTGKQILSKVVAFADTYRGFAQDKHELKQLEKVKHVRWVIYENGNEMCGNQIFHDITRFDLCEALKSGRLAAPMCERGRELALRYFDGNGQHNVSITNKTSDVPDEWYNWTVDCPLVLACISDGVDTYCAEYSDERFKSQKDGFVLSMQEYLENNRKDK